MSADTVDVEEMRAEFKARTDWRALILLEAMERRAEAAEDDWQRSEAARQELRHRMSDVLDECIYNGDQPEGVVKVIKRIARRALAALDSGHQEGGA